MFQTVLSLVACTLMGVLLAQGWLPLGAGYVGAVFMLAAAHGVRAYWQRDRLAPEAVERSNLLSLGATLTCLAFLGARLYQLGPELDVHGRAARAMAGELWTLIAASLLVQWIARAPVATRDERDREIAARALSFSCYALLAMQAVLVAWIGLAADQLRPAPSLGLLAHLFICSWMAAHVLYGLHCMHAYAGTRDLAGQAS